ncbi:MAG: hypothetical protein WCG29_00895 [Desulfomonile sp.]|nr:hypothetical protein [Deltaproteobacteria bacterium]
MRITRKHVWPFEWFPQRRFDAEFPLVFWFVGLWFYLKSFLYVCYLYMLGVEPAPHPPEAVAEIVYFGLAFIPALLLGLALWHEKTRVVVPAIVFLFVDTPLLLFHVLRLAQDGFLDSGLTKILELGSLVLNVVALGWLLGYRKLGKTAKSVK